MKIRAVIAVFAVATNALNLGLSPNYYLSGDSLSIFVNKVESDETQLPYSYKDLQFTCPVADSLSVDLTLGEVLTGNRIWRSNYKVDFGVDVPCAKLCTKEVDIESLYRADTLVRQGYVAQWSLDGLPGATVFHSGKNNQKHYAAGFPLGFVEKDVAYLYNHVTIVIQTHGEENGKSTIVGFEVYPKSVSTDKCPGTINNYENFALPVSGQSRKTTELENKKYSIPFTYSVTWREDPLIDYDSRWDLFYLNASAHSQVHWFSLLNSLVLVTFVSLVVAIVLARFLKKDVEGSSLPINSGDLASPETDEWKSLEKHVKAPPKGVLLFTTLVASGIQFLVGATVVIIVFVINNHLGIGKSVSKNTFFNNHQGAIYSFSIFCFVCSGAVSSFWGLVWYKSFTGKELEKRLEPKSEFRLSLLFCGFLPGVCLLVALATNFFVWGKRSSSALPFGTIVLLILVYVLAVLPLGVLGGYLGNRRTLLFVARKIGYTPLARKPEVPLPAVASPYTRRRIWRKLLNPFTNGLVFGIIPFGIVYVELLFIFNSVWLEKTTFYYMYGFLFATTVILTIVIAESTVVAVYTSLATMGDPSWYWLSFRVGLSLGWYIFAYSLYYFVIYLRIRDFVSVLFYFSYMALVSFLIGLAGGAVSAITGFIFVQKIYGAMSKKD